MSRQLLGDLVKIKTGKLDANACDEDGLYPFFTCAIEPLKINKYEYDCECVLVAGNGDLNVKYYEGKFNAYQRTYIIESNNKEILDAGYLYHFLTRYVEFLRKGSIGGVIKYIKLGHLTDIKIPLPPIETQKQIVEVLDKANELRQKKKQANTKLDEFLQSTFLDMFGKPVTNSKDWTITEFQNIVHKIENGWSPSCDDEYTKPNQWSVLKLSAVKNGFYNQNEKKPLALKFEPKKALEVKKQDLLITRKNTKELVGDCTVVHNTLPNLMIPDTIFRPVLKKEKVLPEYIWGVFTEKKYQQNIRALAGGTAGSMPNISKAKLLSIKVPVPPLELQNKFVQIVKRVEAQKSKNEIATQKLDDLFNSLLQKAFKGELEFSKEMEVING